MNAIKDNRDGVSITLCTEEDIDLLEKSSPIAVREGFHKRRFNEQESGKSSYLILWKNNEPVGHLNLRWFGSREAEVSKYIKDCPELNAIGMRKEFRSRGLGTKLIQTAVDLIKQKGYRQVGLNCAINNTGAMKLYIKLGFKDWGRGIIRKSWITVEEDNEKRTINEESLYLIKSL